MRAQALDLDEETARYPTTFKIEHAGAVFVVKAPEGDDVMTLVTMLPAKK